jgi:MFS family permease
MMHIVRSVSSYPAGMLADRLGLRPALVIGGLLHAVVLVGMGLTAVPGVAIALFLAHGFVAGLTEPAERSAVARLFPDRRGAAFGRFQAWGGVGALLAGLGFGWLYQVAGANWAFLAAAGTSAAVLAGWFAVDRRVGA